MNSIRQDLDATMREQLQDGGYLVEGGRDLFMEVMDPTTGLVWMSAAPVTRHDFNTLELEKPLVKVGIARASMDSAAFHRSPGAPDEPVLQRTIDGRLYINVAEPSPPQERVPPACAVFSGPGHTALSRTGSSAGLASVDGINCTVYSAGIIGSEKGDNGSHFARIHHAPERGTTHQ